MLGASWDVWAHRHRADRALRHRGRALRPRPQLVRRHRRDRRPRRQDRRGRPSGTTPSASRTTSARTPASPTTAPPASPTWRWRSSTSRDARCALDRALHGIDVMTSILKSGETGAFVDLRTTCTRPEPLDPDAAAGAARLRKHRMTYTPAETRYDGRMAYRRCGASGLKLPADLARPLAQLRRRHRPRDQARDLPHAPSTSASPTSTSPTTTARRRARPRPPSARSSRTDLARPPRRARRLHQGRLPHVARPLRRVGQPQVPALLASTRASSRLGLDYVDIFYSHRFDPETPLEETMGALDAAVRSGKALYAGISSYNSEQHPRGGGDPERPRHPLPDPPAELQHDQPLGRARRPEGRRSPSSASARSPSPRSPRAC